MCSSEVFILNCTYILMALLHEYIMNKLISCVIILITRL